MARIRTFIAVEVSPAVCHRASELIAKLQASEVKCTWTAPENMHVTLQFLGDTDDTLIPDVCRRVAQAAAPFEPFEMAFSQAGAFPAPDRPRTVWLGVDAGAEKLVRLQFAIQESLVELRFPREHRTFKPHLTLGRVRDGSPRSQRLAELLAQYRDYKASESDVSEVVIVGSFRDKSGPMYQIIGRAPLEG